MAWILRTSSFLHYGIFFLLQFPKLNRSRKIYIPIDQVKNVEQLPPGPRVAHNYRRITPAHSFLTSTTDSASIFSFFFFFFFLFYQRAWNIKITYTVLVTHLNSLCLSWSSSTRLFFLCVQWTCSATTRTGSLGRKLTNHSLNWEQKKPTSFHKLTNNVEGSRQYISK